MSGDPGESRFDRLATGSQPGIPALLPRAATAATPEDHGR